MTAFTTTARADVSVITPPDRSAVTGELLTIVVSGNGTQIDELNVFVNNRKQRTVAVKPDRKIVCVDGITLSYGSNKIKIVSMREKKKVGLQELTVLLRTSLSPAWTSLQEGVSRFVFHDSLITKQCEPCHQMEFKETPDAAASSEKSPCYVCHKKMLSSYMVAHGPAAVWSCFICHSQTAEKDKIATMGATSRSCVECHDQQINLWKSKKLLHGPLIDGDCIVCHNPHASAFKYLLRLRAYDLCISCHDNIVGGAHVIGGFSGGKHPLKLPRNPYKPGTEFSCASCHNPHAGDSPFFLYNYKGPEEKSEYCKSCHAF